MAKNYSITFKSLRAGTVYTLNIGGGTGDAVPLKGGAQPFVTQEDDSDDQFAPIRTQSGYLRIVDDGYAADGVTAFDWKDLVPDTDLSRPVTLTAVDAQGNDLGTLWQGFMQAQNFSGTLYGNPQEREYPVQCPLAALSASDVYGENRELKNFAYLIKQAFDNVTTAGIPIGRYIFQGGASAQEWLMKLIDWQNLVMGSDDGISSKYDNQRAIKDVCQFWGWCCRSNGQDIIFSCADDRTNMPNALILTQAQLDTLAGGTAAGTTTDVFFTSTTMSGDIFAGVSNDDLRVRGYSRAMVTADGNPADKSVIGFAPPPVEKTMKGLSSYTETDGDKIVYYTNDLTEFTYEYFNGSCRSGYATFNIADVRDSYTASSGSTADVIRIRKSWSSDAAAAYAQMETLFHHSFYDMGALVFYSDGGFTLKGEIWRKATKLEDQDNVGIGNKTMKMRLGIGTSRSSALWFNGTTWTSTETAITIAIGSTDGKFYVKTTSGTLAVVREVIPTNVIGLMGKLFVEFLGSDDVDETDGERSFDIKDFSIEFTRTTTTSAQAESIEFSANGIFGGARKYKVLERADSREYVTKNENKVRSEWNFDNIYASDNDMQNGYGVVLNPNGTQMGKQTYGSAQKFPEQHLCDRVAAYWATAKRELCLELRSDQIGNVTPRNIVTFDNDTFHPIAISREWRDDITNLTLLQL